MDRETTPVPKQSRKRTKSFFLRHTAVSSATLPGLGGATFSSSTPVPILPGLGGVPFSSSSTPVPILLGLGGATFSSSTPVPILPGLGGVPFSSSSTPVPILPGLGGVHFSSSNSIPPVSFGGLSGYSGELAAVQAENLLLRQQLEAQAEQHQFEQGLSAVLHMYSTTVEAHNAIGHICDLTDRIPLPFLPSSRHTIVDFAAAQRGLVEKIESSTSTPRQRMEKVSELCLWAADISTRQVARMCSMIPDVQGACASLCHKAALNCLCHMALCQNVEKAPRVAVADASCQAGGGGVGGDGGVGGGGVGGGGVGGGAVSDKVVALAADAFQKGLMLTKMKIGQPGYAEQAFAAIEAFSAADGAISSLGINLTTADYCEMRAKVLYTIRPMLVNLVNTAI